MEGFVSTLAAGTLLAFIFGTISIILTILMIIYFFILCNDNSKMRKELHELTQFIMKNENSKGRFIMNNLDGINKKLDYMNQSKQNNEMDKI